MDDEEQRRRQDSGPVKYRSWSQLTEYDKCPYAYYLARIERVWKKPAAWLPQGTAVHLAAQKWEESGRNAPGVVVRAWFKDSYKAEIDAMLIETPNTQHWQRSGRYGADEDIPRRFGLGLEHVDRYLDWYKTHPEQTIWTTPEGKLAVELDFVLNLGGVEVRGGLDQAVVTDPDNGDGTGPTVIARDIKTGNTPGKVEQISLYGQAITQADPNVVVAQGDFLMTKTGYPTYPYDLINVDVLTERFVTMNDSVLAGDFPAKPEDAKCDRCDVANSCKFKA